MNLTKLAEIIEQTFKEALLETKFKYGLPKPYKGEQKGKFVTGTLYNSIEAVPTSDGIFLFMADYGKWVQSGRQPGKYVPLNPLEQWVIKKGITFNDKNGNPYTPRAIAAIFSKHIHKWGIPSDPPWMDVAILKLEENKEVQEMLAEIAVDELLDIIQGI